MTSLVQVPFQGDVLWAVRQDGTIYVALRPICEAIGIAWNGQFERIKRDGVLSSTIRVMRTVAADGKSRETVCLPLEYLNGWLFGIDANRVRAEVRDKVIEYQRECYRVLFEHFHAGAVEAVAARMSGEESRPVPLDDEMERGDITSYVSLIRECRATFGRSAAQRLWRRLPLPQPDELPKGDDAVTPEQEWWRQRLVSGQLLPDRPGWPDEVETTTLFDAFWTAGPTFTAGRTRASINATLGRVLHQLAPGLSLRRSSGPGRPWLYRLPPLEQCRAAFTRRFGGL